MESARESDRETAKLVNVLRRIARAATHAAWTRNAEAARFCVTQYNKVLARVSEIEPAAAAALFTPLSETASAEVTRIAAHELAAYFDDEPAVESPRVRVRFHGCGARAWAGAVRVRSCR